MLTFYRHHPFADDRPRITSSYKCECGNVFTNTVVGNSVNPRPAAGLGEKIDTHHVAREGEPPHRLIGPRARPCGPR